MGRNRRFRELFAAGTLPHENLLAEAVKSKLDVDPLSGEEVEKIVAGLFKLEPALVTKMGEILK